MRTHRGLGVRWLRLHSAVHRGKLSAQKVDLAHTAGEPNNDPRLSPLLNRCTSEHFWSGVFSGFAPHALLLSPLVRDHTVSSELLNFDSAWSAWQDVDQLLADSLLAEVSKLAQATEQEDPAEEAAAADDQGRASARGTAADRAGALEGSA